MGGGRQKKSVRIYERALTLWGPFSKGVVFWEVSTEGYHMLSGCGGRGECSFMLLPCESADELYSAVQYLQYDRCDKDGNCWPTCLGGERAIGEPVERRTLVWIWKAGLGKKGKRGSLEERKAEKRREEREAETDRQTNRWTDRIDRHTEREIQKKKNEEKRRREGKGCSRSGGLITDT